jgi:hypothetical protein
MQVYGTREAEAQAARLREEARACARLAEAAERARAQLARDLEEMLKAPTTKLARAAAAVARAAVRGRADGKRHLRRAGALVQGAAAAR